MYEGRNEAVMAEKNIGMSREELEKNIAESIRAVAEHVLAGADTYAMGVSDDAQGIEIRMTFNINEVPTVTFTQDVCPRTWVNAVTDGRCRIWTDEGRRELFE